MKQIQAEFTEVDFKNVALRRAVKEYSDLFLEMLCLNVEIVYCRSNDPKQQCPKCNCWKTKQP